MSLFAEIAFDLPLAGTFTYIIPEEMISSAKPGVRVVAPFGRRKLVGYIISLKDSSEFPNPKEIVKLLDPEIVIPAGIIDLATWISNYYICTLGEALGAALPFWGDIKEVSIYSLTPKGDKELYGGKITDEVDAQMLQYLADNGPAERGSLERKVNGINPRTVNDLKKRGLLKVSKEIVTKKAREKNRDTAPIVEGKIKLTSTQKGLLDTIVSALDSAEGETYLLQGVTGSGKTEVYIRSAAEAVARGRNVIILVPEISLTVQMVDRFISRFGDKVALLHSGLTPVEKYLEWLRILSGEAKIAIGARSAIFAPFEDVGLIVVDEEHDSSYKQEETPRYNARDLAVVRGRKGKGVVLLGSATPSLESYNNVLTGRYKSLTLPERIDGSGMPKTLVTDLRKAEMEGHITADLKGKIEERLSRGEQTLLFLNRRGTAPFIQCTDCGYVWRCANCDISLTYHRQGNLGICHYCGFEETIADKCPECKGDKISLKGVGTQMLEEEIVALFPKARVARLDRDSSRKAGEIERIFERLRTGDIDILIGTQMISKGHDYPNITLVGVILADSMLNIADFRSTERTFQQIVQVSGRGGRGAKEGEVVIQTYSPDHYSIVFATSNSDAQFYERELSFRKELLYPPFARIIGIRIESIDEKKCRGETARLSRIVDAVISRNKGVTKLGPAQALVYRVQNRYRWQIVLKGEDIKPLHSVVRESIHRWEEGSAGTVRLVVDVDPLNLV
ncbi:MAG: primosomal protein N' [Nitrospinota bacterium]|nr:primosomal protein N' [Nitrospinota bacterium]